MRHERRRYQTKPWEELTFADNFLFCKILEDDPELCRQLLELLLRIKIDRLEPPQSERTMQEAVDAKSVRFDVYTKDESRIFDIEIQTTDAKNLPRRARYYQSVIDLDNLARGENYQRLKDSYVIFLCLKDLFRRGLPVYFFENACRADESIKLDDGAYKVFFNAANCDKLQSEAERDFFKFLKGERARTAFSRRIEERVAFARQNMAWRKQYMTWQQTIDEEKLIAFEEGHDAGVKEGHDAGIEEGAWQNARETARNLLRMDVLTLEQVAQATSIPMEEVRALREELARERAAQ